MFPPPRPAMTGALPASPKRFPCPSPPFLPPRIPGNGSQQRRGLETSPRSWLLQWRAQGRRRAEWCGSVHSPGGSASPGMRLDVAPGQLWTPSSPASHLYRTSKSCSRMSMRPSGGNAVPAASSQVPVTRSTGIWQGSGACHCSGGQHRNPALCPQQPHVHPAFAFPGASRAQECRNIATVWPPARRVTAAATGTPKAAPAARVWLAPSSELLPCHKMQTALLYLTLYRCV